MAIEIEISKFSNVCRGVDRTIRLAKQALKDNGKIYSLGPLVHNPVLMQELINNGLIIIDTPTKINKGKFIIRSHGIHPVIIKELREKGIKLIDATCSFVKRTQEICQHLKEKRYFILIIGNINHPEVEALRGFAGKNCIVIDKFTDLDTVNFKDKKIGIICQSTISKKKFSNCVFSILKKNFNEVRIFQTICLDTIKRENEAEQMSKRCDIMVVVGGRMSANTNKLYQICKSNKTKTYFIERPEEISSLYLRNSERIGIIGGASTPFSLIKQIKQAIKKRGELYGK